MYWLAVHCSPAGWEHWAFYNVWQSLPHLGVSDSLSGSLDIPEQETIDLFVTIFRTARREQLWSNMDAISEWRPPAPPYVGRLDIQVAYSAQNVASPSLFPPLTIFCRMSSIVDPDTERDPWIQQDVTLRLKVQALGDNNILPRLCLDKFTSDTFPNMYRSVHTRLVG